MRNRSLSTTLCGALLGILSIGFINSCGSGSTVKIFVTDKIGISKRVKEGWLEIAMYSGDCPERDVMMAGGREGFVKSVSVPISEVIEKGEDVVFEDFGTMPKKSYGFVGYWRDSHCGVTAWGCTPADLGRHGGVPVYLHVDTTAAPLGRCERDQVCINAECRQPPEESPDGGTIPVNTETCELELLGSGEFASALDLDSMLEGPFITTTEYGFVVHYGDATPDPDLSRVISWNVRSDATAAPAWINLPTCSGNKYKWTGFSTVFDFLALHEDYESETPTGILVTFAPCTGGVPGSNVSLNYIRFNGYGIHDAESFRTYDMGRTNIMTTAPTKAFALDDSDGNIFLAVREENKPTPMILAFRNGKVVTDAAGQIEGHNSQVDEFQIATGNGRIPQLARSSDGLLYKLTKIPGGELTSIDKTKGEKATASSLAANLANNNALIAYVVGNSVKWLLDTGNANFSKSGGLTTSFPQPTSVDVARSNKGFIVAVGGKQRINLYRTYDLEFQQPTVKWKEVVLAKELEMLGEKAAEALSNFDGQRLAVATNDKHVLVTWINKLVPKNIDMSVGGYALLYCGGEVIGN